MCSADAATLDCNSGTILGRDVVPDVCNISAMSSAVGALVAGVAEISDDNVKYPAGASAGTQSRITFIPRDIAAA